MWLTYSDHVSLNVRTVAKTQICKAHHFATISKCRQRRSKNGTKWGCYTWLDWLLHSLQPIWFSLHFGKSCPVFIVGSDQDQRASFIQVETVEVTRWWTHKHWGAKRLKWHYKWIQRYGVRSVMFKSCILMADVISFEELFSKTC